MSGGSLTIAFALILFGAALLYSGWTNKPLSSLLTGDNSTARKGGTSWGSKG